MSGTTKKSEKSQKLAEKIAELDKITEYFTQDEVDIDESIKKYESGMKLAKEIKEDLKGYELKIKEIKEKYDLSN